MSTCHTYWGSHGCDLPRGHVETCRCDCADNAEDAADLGAGLFIDVGKAPYYGPDTNFFGSDAAISNHPTVLPQQNT